MTQRFRYYLRVRYQDCDAQKVVFNARYGDYFDVACIEFLRAALPSPQAMAALIAPKVLRASPLASPAAIGMT